MKIGGYSHFNGITFFSDKIKIKGIKYRNRINYDIEWILPPRWLRKLENKFILGGLLIAYYQWKVLDKKIRCIFLCLIAFYIAEGIIDLNFIDTYLAYYLDQYSAYLILGAIMMVGFNWKKILKTFKYHGAEHKVINCYMQHGWVDLYLAKNSSRFNKRCGSNIASIFLLLSTVLWLLHIDSLIILLILFLVSIQITRVLANKDYKWDRYLQILQWVTALEPKDEELEIAVSTFHQLQRSHHILQSEISKL